MNSIKSEYMCVSMYDLQIIFSSVLLVICNKLLNQNVFDGLLHSSFAHGAILLFCQPLINTILAERVHARYRSSRNRH